MIRPYPSMYPLQHLPQEPTRHYPIRRNPTIKVPWIFRFRRSVPGLSLPQEKLVTLNRMDTYTLYLVQSPRHKVRVDHQHSPTPISPPPPKTTLRWLTTRVELKRQSDLQHIRKSNRMYPVDHSDKPAHEGSQSPRADPASYPPTSPTDLPKPGSTASPVVR